jgi:DNA segregation ATPase FtsK/SpoIIIE-like protein
MKRSTRSDLGTLLFTAISIFVWVALISYRSGDPSFFTESTSRAANACGMVGSYLAAGLLQFFGLGGFLMPLAGLFIAVAWHEEHDFPDAILRVLGVGVAVLALTVFLSIHWKTWQWSQTDFLTGGMMGEWLSVELRRYVNDTGASILSLTLFFGVLVLTTPVRIGHWLSGMIRLSGLLLARGSKFILVVFAFGASKAVASAAHKIKTGRNRALPGPMKQTELDLRRAEELAASHTEASRMAAQFDSEEDEEEEVILPAASAAQRSKLEEDILEDVAIQAMTGSTQAQRKVVLAAGPVIEVLEGEKPRRKFKPETKRGRWKLPVIDFLRKPQKVEVAIDQSKLRERGQVLRDKLAEFGIDGDVTAMRVGPVITLFEFKPGPGIKVSKIANLSDDLAMALSASSVRILAPLPGKSVVGIEIPSDRREQVLFREFLDSGALHQGGMMIPMVMGKDIAGQAVLSDLAKMPHLLVAGQTGSGKSVFVNGLICSLLYRFTPDELRMILVDPKCVEFSFYNDIPHLLLPVVDDPKSASSALKWAVREMDRRYRILEALQVRNIASFNEKVADLGSEAVGDILQSGHENEDWMESFERDEDGSPRVGKLTMIVIVIDELADLMMTAKKDVEASIMRISQKARAAGIHLIIATQRPSTNVITGTIKANMNSRVSFSLASSVDSLTILDRIGAKQLLGMGDMLFLGPGASDPVRLQAAFITDQELEKIANFLRDQGVPKYRNEILNEGLDDDETSETGRSKDALFEDAVQICRDQQAASASMLQRKMGIGYPRAAKLIEQMESAGIVGPADGSRPREILIP